MFVRNSSMNETHFRSICQLCFRISSSLEYFTFYLADILNEIDTIFEIDKISIFHFVFRKISLVEIDEHVISVCESCSCIHMLMKIFGERERIGNHFIFAYTNTLFLCMCVSVKLLKKQIIKFRFLFEYLL